MPGVDERELDALRDESWVAHPDAGAALEAWQELHAAIPSRKWRAAWLLANEPGSNRSREEIGAATGYSTDWSR
jgi:hypothetical protein